MKPSGSASTTVKATPSTVIDPFSTTYRSRPEGISTRISGACTTTVPTASTWPWTRCPPRRSCKADGAFQVDRVPRLEDPREVRKKVSSLTSASHQSSRPQPTTVKQHPLTAMEAPMATSSRTTLAPRRSRGPSRDSTCPSSSTIPVNNSQLLLRIPLVRARSSDRPPPAQPI